MKTTTTIAYIVALTILLVGMIRLIPDPQPAPTTIAAVYYEHPTTTTPTTTTTTTSSTVPITAPLVKHPADEVERQFGLLNSFWAAQPDGNKIMLCAAYLDSPFTMAESLVDFYEEIVIEFFDYACE